MVSEVAEMETVGGGFTKIETETVSVQLPCTPTIVYVASETGVAVTISPELLLSSPAGDHVYVIAPDAVRTVESPEQMESEEAETFTVGAVVTFTVTEVLLLHPLSVSVAV